MFEANELLARLEEIQLIIIKATEVIVVLVVCVLGIQPHIKKLKSPGRPKERKKRQEPPRRAV